ncbi:MULTISPECIES: helix-turn-helix transcriptional regulator [unclassified Spirosoma]|uniref:helix-turn-helix domain-containing protein n=1 Tax=unclassified Spirosoma TaxID=2621999 RepID=UPI0009676D6A|nr:MULTISPECIES: helix-turn-helix transcriptional regulator [unclassified Spirosoma]OJW77830.1 MAG: hypothetical protein BGO59_04485 [Spirosoma sp. 48-14]
MVLEATDEETSLEQIDHLIGDARLRAGFTQKELAHELGVAVSTVNKYETTGQKIPIYALAKIAHVCKIDLIVGFQF